MATLGILSQNHTQLLADITSAISFLLPEVCHVWTAMLLCELLLKIIRKPGSVLFVNWCLCEKFSDYLYTPCCYTARQLSFNLGSSLPSQLTFLLEHQSIPERNGRHQSQNCSMSVLEAEKNLNGFRFITMSLYYTRFILGRVEKAMKLWLSDFAELFVLSGCSHILLVVVVFKYFW